jgi:hypothetical protein
MDLSVINRYQSAVDNPVRHWTEVFVTWDDGPKMSMDYVKPIFAEGRSPPSWAWPSYERIKRISSESSGMGITYICDAGDRVVANSTGKELVKYTQGGNPQAIPEISQDSSDVRIRESARFIKDNGIPNDRLSGLQ